MSGVAIAVATRLKVRTQEIWSCVADSAPLSWGRMTVTLVAVRPNRIVVNCTDSRISHCRPVIVHGGDGRSMRPAGKALGACETAICAAIPRAARLAAFTGETPMSELVQGSARGAGQGRHLDADRRAEPPRPQEHDAVRRLADAARAAGDGGHRLHHALHPLARGQGRADLDQPLAWSSRRRWRSARPATC